MRTAINQLRKSGVVIAFLLYLIMGLLPDHVSGQYIIDNDRIRFGNGTEASINSTGNVQQPFYYNATGGWRKLTFSSYPLDYSFAVGGDKTSEWNLNGTRVDNPSLTGQVIDASGFTLTSGYKGYGTIKSTGTITVGSNELRVETTYELLQTKSYVTVKTKVTNLSATTAENVRFWIGTRDDYVGGTDVPLKQKGNLTNGEFVQISNASTRALALQIITGTEGVLFYTTSTKGNTIINSCCSWTNVINQDPSTSTINVTSDGSYGFYVRMNDLAQNQSDEFTWYYAAGELADLEEIINDVAQASGAVSDITYTTANFKATTTANSTGYYVVVPRDATAPTAAQIKAAVNYSGVSIINSGNGAMTANVERIFALSGLTAGTAYDLYFVSEDATPAFSEIAKVQFSTLSYTIPTVTTTDAASSITGVSAVSGGNVTADGGQTVSERGICWNTSGTPTISNSHASSGSGLGTFTASLSSLNPGTTYYIRAYATNSVGTAYGPQVSFTTLPQTLATLTTTAISSISENSASSGGNISSDGLSGVTARGVCWNTSGSPTIANSKTVDGSGTGTFTSSVTGLSASTTYYVRAYATNGVGTAYGNQYSFTSNHILTYLAGANGSISGTSPQSVAHNGNGTAVAAVPDANYHFVNWSDGSTANPRTETNVTASKTVTANFAAHQLVFLTQPVNTTAGQPITVQVKIVDNNNNLVTSANNAITISIANNPVSATLNGTVTVNAVNGIATFSDLNITKTGTGFTLQASASPLVSATSTSFNINPAALSYFSVSGVSDPHVAGTATTPVVTAYDIYNNVKTNYTGTIHFNTNDPIAVLPSDYTFQAGDNGVKTFTGGSIFKTTGDFYLHVADGGAEGLQNNITVTNAALGYFVLNTEHSQFEIDGQMFSITATAYDIFGNLKTDYNGVYNLNWSSNATASAQGTLPVMASNGAYSFSNGVGTINGFILYNAYETPVITLTEQSGSRTGSTPPITLATKPSITTVAATSVTDQAAVSGGVITHNGNTPVIEYGICWNITGSPTISDAHTSDGSGTATFSSDMSGLSYSTTYHVRAYATNLVGTAYGNEITFTTNHFVTYVAGLHGSLQGELVQNIPHLGSGTAVTATGDPDYHFISWNDGSTMNPRTDHAVSGSVTYTAAFEPHFLVFDPEPVSTIAGEAIPVVVRIVDNHNQTISTANNPITIELASNPAGAVLGGTHTVNAVNGVAVFTDLFITKTGESYTLSASSLPLSGSTSAEFEIIPAALSYFTVENVQDPHMAGTPTTPIVKAYDLYDNLKTNYTGTVQFSTDDPIAEVPADYTFTISDAGVKVFTGESTFKTTGEFYLRVNDNDKTGVQDDITVFNAALGYFEIHTQNNQYEIAGTNFSVTATAYDIFGNLKTDYTGAHLINWSTSATASGSGNMPIMAVNGNYTFANGVAVVDGFTLFNAHETPSISITDVASTMSGTTPAIHVQHIGLANFKVECGTSQVAGIPFDITVTARDMYYNTVLNYGGQISFKSSNNPLVQFPLGPQNMAGYNGVRTFEDAILINTAGNYWMRAADASNPVILGTQYNIMVVPGAFSAMMSSLTVDYNYRIAGEYVTATIKPRDAQGNMLGSGHAVVAMLDGVAADFDGPVVVTDHNDGIYTAVIRTTNSTAENIISATVDGQLINQTQDITVVPAAGVGEKLFVAVQPSDEAVAGVAFAQQPVIHILDGFDNIVSDDNSTVVSIGANGSSEFNGTLSATAVNGVVSFSGLSYNIAELITATFTASGYPAVTSDYINILPAATAYLGINHPSDFEAGSTRAHYTVNRYDVYGNSVFSGTENYYLYTSSNGNVAGFFEEVSGGSPVSGIFINDGDNSADFYYYDEATGDWTVTVSDHPVAADGAAGIADASDVITIQPSTLIRFEVSDIGNPHVYGVRQGVLVKALDFYGNIKTDYVGTITFQVTDPLAQKPQDYNFQLSDNGVKFFDEGLLFSMPGVYWVTVMDRDEPAYYGYQQNIVVEPRPITIKANDITKEYGEGITLDGDEFEIIGNMAIGQFINQLSITCSGAAENANAGQYQIDISNPVGIGGFSLSNYTIDFIPGTMTVEKAPLTVTLNDSYSKTYGEADPVFGYSVNGFKLNDDAATVLSGDIARASGENAGSYGFSTGTLDAGQNYQLLLEATDFVINKASLTITAQCQCRLYGQENQALSYSITGFVNGDDESDISSPSIFTAGNQLSPVGTYPIVVSGAASDNYNITHVNGNLVISKAELEIAAEDVVRQYGQPDPVLNLIYTGFANNEDASVITVPEIECEAEPGSDAGVYDIVLSGGDAENYNITLVNGTFTILKADQVISFDSIPAQSLNTGYYELFASASSDLPVSYTISNPSVANLFNNALYFLVYGTTEVVAHQEGNNNYNAAPDVSRTLVVADLSGIAGSGRDEFEFYPNPSNGQFMVISPDYASTLSIYNMSGQVVLQRRIEKGNATMISIEPVAGVYTLVFDTPGGPVSKRLIIE